MVTMYRQYEDPVELQKQLDELRNEYRIAVENAVDENILVKLACYIAELEERVNFAWQDDEYDSEY
jgi:hypothetical protein